VALVKLRSLDTTLQSFFQQCKFGSKALRVGVQAKGGQLPVSLFVARRQGNELIGRCLFHLYLQLATYLTQATDEFAVMFSGRFNLKIDGEGADFA
jgi:hypothetical protein